MTQRSNLRDLVTFARKRPYIKKADQNFAVMTTAEQKRRRKHLLNLEHALSGGSHLWTSPN